MKKKQRVKEVSINILIIFVSVLFLTNTIIKPKEIKAITERQTISTLEIQQTNKFKLTEDNTPEYDKILTQDIEFNELPNIQAKLLNDKNITVKENEEITLRYEIQPESFSFKDETNVSKSDVVFVIDVSKDMSNYMQPLKNDIWNDILNNDKLKSAKTEYDIITFANEIKNIVDLSSSNYERYDQYITDLNKNYIDNILNTDKNPNAKNIKTTYANIIDLLEKGREGARKNVVFISETSNISYGSDKDYGNLKEKGYNIITVEIENLNNGNNKNDLKDFHKLLNGKDENYFYSKDENELQNNILVEVANSIISNSDYKEYNFFPKLQIDLGENFELVSGAEKVENNIAIIDVPKIIYKYSKINNMYNAENGNGEKVNVEFTIRPKSKKIGSLSFGSENKLIYKKLIKNEDKYSLVETPIIIVKEQVENLIHGLYNGIENNYVNIQVNKNEKDFEIAQNSTVIFGAKFTLSGNSIDFNLNIDSKFNQVNSNDIKVYKIIKDSSGKDTLIEIVNGSISITDEGSNNFNISIKDFKGDSLEKDTDILVVYKARVKSDIGKEDLVNQIKFVNLSKEIKIVTPTSTNESPTLPDLF